MVRTVMSEADVQVREITVKTEWEPDISEEVGSYANVMEIRFNQHEFVLAFGQIVSVDIEKGVQKCKLVSKLVVPHHLVPQIISAMNQNLQKFVGVFGPPSEPKPIDRKVKRAAG